MSRLRPFFSFYGSKWRLAPFYSPPGHNRIIECFAGSASYATLHHTKDVLLVDIDPVICAVWDYLIRVPESELLALPVDFAHVDDLSLCQEAKWFVGFWLNRAHPTPCLRPSAWGREQIKSGKETGFWSERVRGAIAKQLQFIRHWQVLNASYVDTPEHLATYFVDPPYVEMGHRYKFNKVDFAHLGEWCRARADAGSQVIACEAEGATWLPFRQFRRQTHVHPGRKSKYSEVVWEHTGFKTSGKD